MGVGGYSSGPVLLLAALRRIPTLLMEQNTAPGFTNRRLAPWVRAAALSYDESLRYFPGIGVVTGNPVRRAFLNAVEAGHAHSRAPSVRITRPELHSTLPRELPQRGATDASKLAAVQNSVPWPSCDELPPSAGDRT